MEYKDEHKDKYKQDKRENKAVNTKSGECNLSESTHTEYTLVRRVKQKTLRMYFKDNGNLIVSAPYNMSQQKIDSFVHKNSCWIEQHQQHKHNYTYTNNDKFILMGTEYTLAVVQSHMNKAVIKGCVIELQSKFPADTQLSMSILKDLYTNTFTELLSRRIPFWANKLGVEIPIVKIGKSTTAWGTCNKTRKAITFSIRTACLSEDLADSVIVHELCHLKHPNHGKYFWNLVYSAMPDYEERNVKLNKYVPTLRGMFAPPEGR